MSSTDKSPSEISDFKENHTDTTVSFTVTATKEKIDEFEKFKGGLYGKFKLQTTISTKNMTGNTIYFSSIKLTLHILTSLLFYFSF